MHMPKGSGIAIGIAIGVAIGAAFDNIGIGIAIGTALGAGWDAWSWNSEKGGSAGAVKNPENEARVAEQDAQVARLYAEIHKRGEMTNNDVEAFLGVSDATAERYLQELESTGKIVQVGETGQAVKYRVAG